MVILAGFLGLCFGSFVNALVWRLKKHRNFVSERSECTHCHHILAWYDLVPVVSWVSLRGQCRYCHKSIDDSPVTEIVVAAVFAASVFFWPFGFTVSGLVLLALWLSSVVLLAALFLYDLRWMLLPDGLIIPLTVLGALWVVVRDTWWQPAPLPTILLTILTSLASVAGLYGLLYLVSKGAWVGFGDVKLGLFMGLVLGWQGGLLAVALANMLAFAVVAPGLIRGKIKRTAHIPFGPFLIAATVIVLLFGQRMIDWYIAAVISF